MDHGRAEEIAVESFPHPAVASAPIILAQRDEPIALNSRGSPRVEGEDFVTRLPRATRVLHKREGASALRAREARDADRGPSWTVAPQ